MSYLNIDTSATSFLQIRRNDSYYIDKTPFLADLLRFGLKGKMLFTRPRRFGKSVTLSMIREFLDITKDSHDLFEGLKIMEEKDLVERHMNQYPVVFFSMKEVYGDTIGIVRKKLLSRLASLTVLYFQDVMENPHVDSRYKTDFKSVHDKTFDTDLLSDALETVCKCLCQNYQKPVVVLIDEYDVPLSKAYGTSHYDAVKDLIESMLSSVCKENDTIQAVILTGCLYSIKGSTHTGVNNIDAYTLTMPPYSQYFGFIEEEVAGILTDAGLSDQLPLVREWYDGYLFGDTHIYCPWDVLKFVADMQRGVYRKGRAVRPKNYWVNTSGTMIDFLRGFLDKTPDAASQFDLLLSGKAIEQPINESLPYHELHASGRNLWSALLEDGYLTLSEDPDSEEDCLRIPNKEIKVVLMQEIGNYFLRFSQGSDMTDFWLSLWNGETESAMQILNDRLELSFKNLSAGLEYPYQYFLLGAALGQGYQAEAEADAGYGRLDLKIEQPSQNRGLILETKHVKDIEEMESAIEDAKGQILKLRYYRQLQAKKVGLIRCYAAVFYKRECRIEEVAMA